MQKILREESFPCISFDLSFTGKKDDSTLESVMEADPQGEAGLLGDDGFEQWSGSSYTYVQQRRHQDDGKSSLQVRAVVGLQHLDTKV